MDILVLGCLGYTIYLALRLSKGLENFKSNRSALQGLIETLTQNIHRAESATIKLKEDSYETADELRSLIREAKEMKQDIELMTEAGDNLAKRLEGLAQAAPKNIIPQRETRQSYKDIVDDGEVWLDDEEEIYLTDTVSPSFTENEGGGFASPFAIQDRDLDDDVANVKEFKSEAERELYEALQQKRKAAG